MKNGEKSLILNGAARATMPKTRVPQTITEAIISPRTIQFSSFLADITAKYVSGKQFPKATTKRPTRPKETLRAWAKYWAA